MRRIVRPQWPDFDLQLHAGSGAGLNYYNRVILRCAAAASATYDSGVQAWEAAFFSKTSIQLLAQLSTATMSGWSVMCYGTHDLRALLMKQSPLPPEIPSGFTLPSTSWIQIAMPQSETSPTWQNPITAFGASAYSPEPWVAIRVVATATSATGDIAVTCSRVP